MNHFALIFLFALCFGTALIWYETIPDQSIWNDNVTMENPNQ